MHLGKRIRLLRKARGLSQRQLADRAEIFPQAVSGYEREEYEPSSGTQELIALALGVTRQELLFGDIRELVSAASSPADTVTA